LPVEYCIDAEQGVVYTTLKGKVTFAEFAEHLKALAADPDFRNDMCELLDGGDAETDEFNIGQIMSFKQSHVWGANARRALTASSDLGYGLFSIFQKTDDGEHGDVQLFRDITEARRWLGLAE